MNKVRILWISDQHEGFPESELPDKFRNTFEIVDPRPTSQGPYAADFMFPTATNFVPHLKDFWFKKDTSILPCEILVTDYDLSRFPGDESPQSDSKNFNGLIISSLYSCLTHRHPSALVPTTAYLESLSREPGVITLHTLSEPFVGARFEQNLGGLERSWENILRVGLPHLQTRIETLYEEGHLVIPPADLFEILDGSCDVNIRIKSPHGFRTLPINGLFFFNDSDPKEWAEGLLKTKIGHENFIAAENIAKVIWSTYNNDVLMDEHAMFSNLHLEDQSKEEYISLKPKFGLKETNRSRNKNNKAYECTSKVVSEIRKYSCTQEEKAVRRWAALFLIRRLLKRQLLFIDATGMRSVTRDGKSRTQSLYPTLEEDDILLLFYPIPSGPFPLPWHLDDAKLRANKIDGSWRKWLRENLHFQPKDVLDGSVMTIGERQILQGIVMDKDIEFGPDPEARLERWKSYEPARLFLFGPDTTVEC